MMSLFRKSKKIIKQTMVMGFLIVTKNRKKIIKNNGCGDGSFLIAVENRRPKKSKKLLKNVTLYNYVLFIHYTAGSE